MSASPWSTFARQQRAENIEVHGERRDDGQDRDRQEDLLVVADVAQTLDQAIDDAPRGAHDFHVRDGVKLAPAA